jgi:hypothetical protein
MRSPRSALAGLPASGGPTSAPMSPTPDQDQTDGLDSRGMSGDPTPVVEHPAIASEELVATVREIKDLIASVVDSDLVQGLLDSRRREPLVRLLLDALSPIEEVHPSEAKDDELNHRHDGPPTSARTGRRDQGDFDHPRPIARSGHDHADSGGLLDDEAPNKARRRSMLHQPRLGTAQEAAGVLGVSRDTLDRMRGEQRRQGWVLPGDPVQIGQGKKRRHERWDLDRVEEWAKALRERSGKPGPRKPTSGRTSGRRATSPPRAPSASRAEGLKGGPTPARSLYARAKAQVEGSSSSG